MEPSIWGVFHDGVIKRIDGTVPGQLVLGIEIPYLRAMFEGNGTGFNVRLQSCTKVKYSEYDEQPIEDLARIQEREPEVLYLASEHPLVLDCAMGTLELTYEEMLVTLDSGGHVSEEELAEASELYWQRWGENTKRDA
jgi:hypothetical protein